MTTLNNAISTQAAARLEGRWAWLTRIAGAAYIVVIGLCVIFGLPYGYRILTQTCPKTPCSIFGQLTATNVQDLQKIGLSVDTYATIYAIVFVLYVSICMAAAALLLWKKPGELMPLSAAIFIVGLIVIEGQFVFLDDFSRDYPLLMELLSILFIPGSLVTAYLVFAFPSGKFKKNIFFLLFIAMGVSQSLVDAYMVIFMPNVHQDPSTLSLPVAVPLTLVAIVVSYLREKDPAERKIGKYLLYTLICLIAALASSVLGFLVYLVALVYRSKKVLTPRERNSVKWLIWGFTVFLVMLVSFYLSYMLIPELTAPGTYYFLVLNYIGFFGCGINLTAILMAILYGNAFDINLVIKRTIVYTALSLFIIAIYLGSVVGLQALVRSLTGQKSDLAIVAATLVAALLFQPLRGAIQHFVDRRFYRRKFDAARTIDNFGTELQSETDLKALSQQLKEVLGETLQPEQVSIWFNKNTESKKS